MARYKAKVTYWDGEIVVSTWEAASPAEAAQWMWPDVTRSPYTRRVREMVVEELNGSTSEPDQSTLPLGEPGNEWT